MASLFECEVRYIIEDIQTLERRLKDLGGRVLYSYAFKDYYFKPTGSHWDFLKKNLRIRRWQFPLNPTIIYFAENEVVSIDGVKFKRSLYPQGKVALFKGNISICKSLLKDLGFEECFVVVKKKAKLWEVPRYKFKTAIEYIKGIGWVGELEFEGKNKEKAKRQIKSALKTLGINRKLVRFEPVSVIFKEKMRL